MTFHVAIHLWRGEPPVTWQGNLCQVILRGVPGAGALRHGGAVQIEPRLTPS